MILRPAPVFTDISNILRPPPFGTFCPKGCAARGRRMPLEINADYVIRRTILFDNKCGFALGENPKAPSPYVTWQFNEKDGHRDYFWGHYHDKPDMAERDLHNRAEDYQRRYHVFEVEQEPDKETYKYYSTQRPIDLGTYPDSYFNRPIHMDIYPGRQQVPGEAFQAWGAITYTQPLTEQELRDYELRPSRDNRDIRRQMDAQAQVVGKWEDAHHVPEQKRLTWFYPDFGSYVVKEYVIPDQLAVRVRSIERQEAAKAHKGAKEKPAPISQQMLDAQVVGKWEDAHRTPAMVRLTQYNFDLGRYVPAGSVTPQEMAECVREIKQMQAQKARTEAGGKPAPISQQMKDAQAQAEADRGPAAPRKDAPDRGDR